MKIFWIGGSHFRHLYYINTIARNFNLCGAIIEARESILPAPPAGLSPSDLRNHLRHFADRDQAERLYFGEQPWPSCPTLEATKETLNSNSSADFFRQFQPDLTLIFGCGMVQDPLFSALTGPVVNLHLGLSPRYRGSATLFWPFYFLEPTYAGSTFHYIVAEPDAGQVIHQVTAQLHREDGIHDVGCKTVVESARQAIFLLQQFQEKGTWTTRRQKATGKNFLSSDFKTQHLRVVYELYNNEMVRHYLDGELQCRTPSLYRQF